MEIYRLFIILTWAAGCTTAMYMCGVDVCDDGVQFCDTSYRICRRCDEYLHDCFTVKHVYNCTRVCRDDFRKKHQVDVSDLELQISSKLRLQPCMPLPKLDNGQHNGSLGNFSNGDVVMFACDSKYRLVGANNVTCNYFGTWSAGLPTCYDIEAERRKLERQVLDKLRLQPCMPIPKLENGQHNGTFGNFSNGDVVMFTCDKEYRLIGANNVTCNDFGAWSAGLPTCDDIGNYSTNAQFWFIACICTFVLLILAMVGICALWCKLKRLKKKRPKKGNIQKDQESVDSARTETPPSSLKHDEARQPFLPSGAAEGGGEPSQSDETGRKRLTINVSNETETFSGVQEERKGATGELHACARTVEPGTPSDKQSEEVRVDESPFTAQAPSYHQQERQDKGARNKIAMGEGEVDRQDLGYTN